ncbi:hypothetical protein ACS0TY_019037 [Phlomoides rotata]
MLQDRIPSIMNLRKRGAYNQNYSTFCRLCGLNDEDTDHLFFDCPAAKKVWFFIFRWIGMDNRILTKGMDHLEDFLSLFENHSKGVGNPILAMHYMEYMESQELGYLQRD